MDAKTMSEVLQEIREWRAAAEERLSRTEERVDGHSDRLSKSEILLNTLLTRAEEARNAAANVKWFVMISVALCTAILKFWKG